MFKILQADSNDGNHALDLSPFSTRLDPTRPLLRLPGLVVTVPVIVPSTLDTDGVLGLSLSW